MRPRVLVVLISIALLVLACSGGTPAPTWTDAPNTSAAAAPSETAGSTATVAPPVAPSVAPSVALPAEPLIGEVAVVLFDTMRFAPDPITVKAGEEVTFVVTNDGVIVHEFFVGTEEAQLDHAAEMTMGGMTHGHGNAISLKAGETGSLTMTFGSAGSLIIGCHEPGHYDAGMKATLTVVD